MLGGGVAAYTPQLLFIMVITHGAAAWNLDTQPAYHLSLKLPEQPSSTLYCSMKIKNYKTIYKANNCDL